MGFSFRRRIKVLPGVHINVSQGGVSTSVGTRGARVTIGRGRRRMTVGVPGTGLSYTSVASSGPQSRRWGFGKTAAFIFVAVLIICWMFG